MSSSSRPTYSFHPWHQQEIKVRGSDLSTAVRKWEQSGGEALPEDGKKWNIRGEKEAPQRQERADQGSAAAPERSQLAEAPCSWLKFLCKITEFSDRQLKENLRSHKRKESQKTESIASPPTLPAACSDIQSCSPIFLQPLALYRDKVGHSLTLLGHSLTSQVQTNAELYPPFGEGRCYLKLCFSQTVIPKPSHSM